MWGPPLSDVPDQETHLPGMFPSLAFNLGQLLSLDYSACASSLQAVAFPTSGRFTLRSTSLEGKRGLQEAETQ